MPAQATFHTHAVIVKSIIAPSTTTIIAAAEAAALEPTLNIHAQLAWCIVGAVSGAILALSVWTPLIDERPEWLARRIFFKWGSSFCGGVTLAPWAIEYYQLPCSVATCLGVSTVVSAVVVALLHAVMPHIERVVDEGLRATIRRIFGKDK